MKIAYFDCFAGISGDMIVAALVDAGLEPDRLTRALAGLPISDYEIFFEKTTRNGLSGTRFRVEVREQKKERNLDDILDIIAASQLNEIVRKDAADIFGRIASVEAEIHGTTPDKIHFHEIGAVDSIVDIVCACAAIDLLGIDTVCSSPINVGEGFIDTGHGTLPVPAPATASLLRGAPVYSSGIRAELATPTGAAVISHFARRFGSLPDLKIERVGYGAGMRDLPVPNLLRVYIGEQVAAGGYESIIAIETNIDDMNPEFYQHVFEGLFAAGALDVFTTPVMMKKSRPGVLIRVLAREESREALAGILFNETTTAGVRIGRMERMVLDREVRMVPTRFGEIAVKFLSSGGTVMTVSPEYEDCRRAAKSLGVPLKQVYDEAKKAAGSLPPR